MKIYTNMKNKLGLMMAAMVFASYWQSALCEFTPKYTIRNEDVGASKNGFGWDLAIDGNILAVADSGISQGRLHIIRLNADSTELIKTLSPPRVLIGENDFGTGVFVKGNTIGAGAIHTRVSAIHDGRFSIFNIKEDNIDFSEDFNPSPATAGRFGYDSAISGEVLCVSQYGNESWRRDAGFYFYKISNGKTKEFGRYIVPGDYSYAVALTAHNNKFFAAVRKPSKHSIISFSVIKDQFDNYTLNKVQELELIKSEALSAPPTLTKTNMQGLAANGNYLAVGDPENRKVSLYIIQEDGKLEWYANTQKIQIGSSNGDNRYGASVALIENFLFIGQPNANEPMVFWSKLNKPASDEPTAVFGDRGKLVPHGLRDGERFGSAIAASDDKIAITGRGDNSSSIYIFEKQIISSPVVALQPESQEVQLGGTAELTVEAKGEELSYQWYHEIPKDYQITAVFKGNGAEIELGLPYSSLYNYKIGEIYKPADWGLTIAGQPVSDGSGEIHIVEKSHEEPYLIPDATSSTYRIENITKVDLGNYFVKVTNPSGSVKSEIARLNLRKKPIISLQPQSQSVGLGGSIELEVGASGTEPLDYQWYKDGQQIAEATSPIYRIPKVTQGDFGGYSVRVKNVDGEVISKVAELRLTATPKITLQPKDQTAAIGSRVEFVVEAIVEANLKAPAHLKAPLFWPNGNFQFTVVSDPGASCSIQYSFDLENWMDYRTDTNPGELHVPVTPAGTKGMYFRVLVKGKGYSDNIVGYENFPNPIEIPLSSGPWPLDYQWYKNGIIINGANDATYSVTDIKESDFAVYNVKVTNSVGSVSSEDAKLEALKPGDMKWKFETIGSVSSFPAIGRDGTVFISSFGRNDTIVYAINPDGTKKWEFSTESAIYDSLTIGDDGTLYFATEAELLDGENPSLCAVNPDGTKKWEFKTGNSVYSSPAIGSHGTIFIGSGDSNVYAINSDGTKKWEFKTGNSVYSSPAVGGDGTIYVGSDDGNFYAINPDGSKKWAFKTGGAIRLSPALGNDGTIYVGSDDKNFYAINPDGSKKWAFRAKNYNQNPDYANGINNGLQEFSSSVIGIDGTVYIGSYIDYFPDSVKGIVIALNPDGSKKWEFYTGFQWHGNIRWRSYLCPVIGSDGTVYAGIRTIFAINPDGTQKWKFGNPTFTTGYVFSPPAIGSNGTLYIGSYDHNLYAIKTSSTGPADSPWPMFGRNAQHTGRLDPKAPTIKITQTKPTLITISFKDLSGKPYALQSSADLLNWQSLDNDISQTDEVELAVEPEEEKTFYRIKLKN